MPTVIHLADERASKAIKINGLKIGKWRKGIFFMPVTQDFFASHQWLRELRRRGIRTYVGIHFKLDSQELVWFGKYNIPHRYISLGEAIAEFMAAEDKLGYEFLIGRKILSSEIESVRSLPQKIGWRYFPHSHRRPLTCGCPMCIGPGEIKARKKRARVEARNA